MFMKTSCVAVKKAITLFIAFFIFPSCQSDDPKEPNDNDGVEKHEIVIVGGGISGLS